MPRAYQVYVIRNPAGKFYIGISEDIQRRLDQHNRGDSRWTRGQGPWTLVWQSDALSLTGARRLENRLKRQAGQHHHVRRFGRGHRLYPDRQQPVGLDHGTIHRRELCLSRLPADQVGQLLASLILEFRKRPENASEAAQPGQENGGSDPDAIIDAHYEKLNSTFRSATGRAGSPLRSLGNLGYLKGSQKIPPVDKIGG